MEINAKLVKKLREQTALGLMDCKKALKETKGNIKEAIIFLKEKGMLKAAEKSGRTTKDGIINIAVDNNKAIITEINCETDFVAKTPDFISKSQDITQKLLNENVNDINNITPSIENKLKELIAKLGENMTINRIATINIDSHNNEHCSHYIHQGAKIGVLLKTKVNNNETLSLDSFKMLTKDICMHIAAMNPTALTENEVDNKIKKEQQEIFTKQAEETKKPKNIIEKIALGKMTQYIKDITLINQVFVKDPKITINKLIASESKKLNDNIIIKSFVRFKVGE